MAMAGLGALAVRFGRSDEAARGVEDEIVAEDDGVFFRGLDGDLTGALAVRAVDQDGGTGSGEDVVAARSVAGHGADTCAGVANEASAGHQLAVGLSLCGRSRTQNRHRSEE